MQRYSVSDDAVSVRLYEDGDLPQVLELLKASLGESASLRRTPDLFSWKHLDNPFGRSIMIVAHDRGTITGFRAFMRWDLVTVNGDRVRCVRAVDTATHPDYRRRGIFRTLTLAAVEVAEGEGIDMIFNTPNPRSGAGYASMGWTEVGAIRPMASPARGLLSRAPGATLLAAEDFVDPVTDVQVHAMNDRTPRGLRTPRTERYLAWRFTEHPTARYVQEARVPRESSRAPDLRRVR